MNRKERFKYFRFVIDKNNKKEKELKSGIFGAAFDLPKKVKRNLLKAKNKNHKNYLINKFLKIAVTTKSNNVVNYLNNVQNNIK